MVNFGTIFSGSILSFHSNLNQVGLTLTKCKIDGGSFLKSSDELGAQFENLKLSKNGLPSLTEESLGQNLFIFSA